MIIFVGIISEEHKTLVCEIFLELNEKMYAKSYKILGNRHDAEDALSATFIKIMQNIDKISALSRPRMEYYCVIILRNETVNVIRKRKKVIYLEDMNTFEALADNNSIETEFLKKADIEILKAYIGKLSDDERDFLHLRFNKEMSLKQIAEFFDITEEAAKKRSQRIIKKLKMLYDKGDDEIVYRNKNYDEYI